mmetsp:Transcript_24239/g.72827  ORF Transcript_24239/g.72827 Transcript_24239/m.72827 type:complete len:226 (+) Transcript_24239:264-941(+)
MQPSLRVSWILAPFGSRGFSRSVVSCCSCRRALWPNRLSSIRCRHWFACVPSQPGCRRNAIGSSRIVSMGSAPMRLSGRRSCGVICDCMNAMLLGLQFSCIMSKDWCDLAKCLRHRCSGACSFWWRPLLRFSCQSMLLALPPDTRARPPSMWAVLAKFWYLPRVSTSPWYCPSGCSGASGSRSLSNGSLKFGAEAAPVLPRALGFRTCRKVSAQSTWPRFAPGAR